MMTKPVVAAWAGACFDCSPNAPYELVYFSRPAGSAFTRALEWTFAHHAATGHPEQTLVNLDTCRGGVDAELDKRREKLSRSRHHAHAAAKGLEGGMTA